jgi:hypothetical protein
MNITYIGYIDLEGRFRCWRRCRAALKGRTNSVRGKFRILGRREWIYP